MRRARERAKAKALARKQVDPAEMGAVGGGGSTAPSPLQDHPSPRQPKPKHRSTIKTPSISKIHLFSPFRKIYCINNTQNRFIN
jgi:hypothetical protein